MGRRRKRDTYNYELKRGRRIVYRGITKNPNRRLGEHKRSGKRFTHMRVHSCPVTRSTALQREKK